MPRKPSQKITTKAVQESEGLPPPSLATLPPAKPEDEGDAPWDKEGLTFKQRAFVKAFVGPAAGNATKAAAMAGYSDSNRNVLAVTGWETLRKPNVQRAISRAVAEREGGPEWTRAGVVEIARSSASDYLVFDTDEKGNRIPRADLIAAMEAGALGTIKKIKFDPETGGIVQIEGYDRLAALNLLAKMHGIAPDQTNVTFTTPQQQALGQMLRDPAALAMARQLADRMNGQHGTNGNGSNGKHAPAPDEKG
jgi:hypothetical protein